MKGAPVRGRFLHLDPGHATGWTHHLARLRAAAVDLPGYLSCSTDKMFPAGSLNQAM